MGDILTLHGVEHVIEHFHFFDKGPILVGGQAEVGLQSFYRGQLGIEELLEFFGSNAQFFGFDFALTNLGFFNLQKVLETPVLIRDLKSFRNAVFLSAF